MFLANSEGMRSLRRAGAQIESAAPALFLAIFLAFLSLLFAINAQASFAESNTPAPAGEETQPTAGGANATEAGTSPPATTTAPNAPNAGMNASSGGSGEGQSGGTAGEGPQEPTPGPPTSPDTGGAASTPQAPAPVPGGPVGGSGAQATIPPSSPPLASRSLSPQASAAGPVATGEGSTPASGAGAMTEQATPSSSAGAGAGAIMLERASHAEIIAGSWPALVPGDQPETVALADLQTFVGQFESLLRASRALSGAEVLAPEATRAAAQVLALVSVISSPPSLSPAARGPLPAAGDWSEVSSAIASAERSSEVSSRSRSQRLGAAARTSGAPELARPAMPSLAGAALGGGAPGLAAPAAALLLLAAACLLATRSLGRLPMDPLAWKSTLLCVRLERPG
jgi:hypothetical protein